MKYKDLVVSVVGATTLFCTSLRFSAVNDGKQKMVHSAQVSV